MSTHYRQLTQAQRYQIWSLRETDHKLRAIGKIVGVDFSAVSRELRRNRPTDGDDPQSAHCLSIRRTHTVDKSNKLSAKTETLIEKGLGLGGCPEAMSMSQRMKLENLSKNERLSHTTIYRRVARDRQQGGPLYRGCEANSWTGGYYKTACCC